MPKKPATVTISRKRYVECMNLVLEAVLDAKFDNGDSIFEHIMLTNEPLRKRVLRVFFDG